MYFYLPGKVDIMIDIFKRYCVDSNAARFLTIYIAEAHAADEWWLPDSPNAKEGEGIFPNVFVLVHS